MDYYQSVVIDYIRADRTMFVNTETCIQLKAAPNPDLSGPHWYCDAVTLDMRAKSVFLVEISYGARLAGLRQRLKEWSSNWPGVLAALVRDCHISPEWPVRPWLFVPEDRVTMLVNKHLAGGQPNFVPRITPLEMVQPWLYHSWNRDSEDCAKKPGTIPSNMRV